MLLIFMDSTTWSSGQRLDNVNQIHLVLASGKIIIQKVRYDPSCMNIKFSTFTFQSAIIIWFLHTFHDLYSHNPSVQFHNLETSRSGGTTKLDHFSKFVG